MVNGDVCISADEGFHHGGDDAAGGRLQRRRVGLLSRCDRRRNFQGIAVNVTSSAVSRVIHVHCFAPTDEQPWSSDVFAARLSGSRRDVEV